MQGATVAVGMIPFSCHRAAGNVEAGTETEVVACWFDPSHGGALCGHDLGLSYGFFNLRHLHTEIFQQCHVRPHFF